MRILFLFACCLGLAGVSIPGARVDAQAGPGFGFSAAANAQPTSTSVVVLTATAQADGSLIHVVQPGETLWSIAVAYGVTVDQLKAYNNLSPTPVIFAGSKLMVKPPFTPTPSPTITSTPAPPTRTPRPTSTAAPPTRTPTPTLRPTPTKAPILPALGSGRRSVGIALIVVCALGVLLVSIFSLRTRK